MIFRPLSAHKSLTVKAALPFKDAQGNEPHAARLPDRGTQC